MNTTNTNTKNWQKVVDDVAAAEAKLSVDEANAQKTAQEQTKSAGANNSTVKTLSEDHGLTFPEHDELGDKLTAAEKLADQYWNDLLRTKAEMENFQRRAERDITNAHKYAVEKIAAELLPVVDNLERCLGSRIVSDGNNMSGNEALNNVYIGVELTLKMFLDVLQKFEIKAINPVGEAFNHQYHNAMQVREDADTVSNTVLQVVQKGYILKDRLLRPAMVIVAK